MNSLKLLPCPFCGGDAELYEQKHREYARTYYVHCKGFCVRQTDYSDADRAIKEWNTRMSSIVKEGEFNES